MDELEDVVAVAVEAVNGTTRVVVKGAMSVMSARRFHDVLRQVRDMDADTAMDLADVDAIDASGIQLLLALHTALRRRGRALSLLRLPEVVTLALQRAGVEGTLVARETTREATRE